jgi:DNA-binding transcriptional ArsR family regulator
VCITMTETSDARVGTTDRPATTHPVIFPPAAVRGACHRRVTNAQLEAAAASFDMLSVPGRLHLVWLLAAGEYDVTTLAELTGANIPAASQQLAKLRAAGIVTARRDGRRQLYRVEDPHILTVIEHMFSHIAPDGTLTRDPVPDPRRPPRRPRFHQTRS